MLKTLKENFWWWFTPIVLVVVRVVGCLIVAGDGQGGGLAPFIYSIF
ncbi:MAG: hypothetical protein JNM63_13305 [Spirochaetia bacterium]|nr:hypothetical protein [Spirochaetia bacterium]